MSKFTILFIFLGYILRVFREGEFARALLGRRAVGAKFVGPRSKYFDLINVA